MVDMLLLVPAHPLRPTRPDDHFAAEAAAARAAGVPVGLVDHDALAAGGPDHAVDRAVATVPAGTDAVYRGWMLRGERYAALVRALANRGVTMRTNAEQYRKGHEFPGWYVALSGVTPPSAWTIGFDRADFDEARAELGASPAVLRDYTKSMKHYWREAALIPDLGDRDAAWTVASRFLALRGADRTGGFVLRRFERFASAELRTWWVNGTCRLIGPHPDTAGQDMPAGRLGLAWLTPLVADLGLPFVTVDLALRVDGVWRVVELGDGQVSDRPDTIEPVTLIAALQQNDVVTGVQPSGPYN